MFEEMIKEIDFKIVDQGADIPIIVKVVIEKETFYLINGLNFFCP